MSVGPHAKGAAGNPDYVAGPATVRWPIVSIDVRAQQCHGISANPICGALRADIPETLPETLRPARAANTTICRSGLEVSFRMIFSRCSVMSIVFGQAPSFLREHASV
jgi:hypothetical protein